MSLPVIHQVPRWPQLLGNISLLLSGTALARLFTALVLILVARQIGPAQFGQYTACFTLAWLASPLFSLGLDNWLLGYGGRSGITADLTTHASTCLTIKLTLGLLWLLGIAAVAPLLDPNVFPPLILVLAAATVWLDELGRLVWAVFETALRNRSTLVLMVTMQALVFVAVGALVLMGEDRLPVYVMVQAVATAVGSTIGIFWQVRQFGFSLAWVRLLPTIRATVPFGLSLALALVYGRADIMLVAQWLGKAAAGLYAPAVSLVSAIALIPLAIYNVILPVLSQTYSQNRARMAPLIQQTLLLSLILGLCMGGGIIWLARPTVNILYGADYTATGTILIILSGVLFARSINLSAAAALIALHQQPRRVYFQVIAAVFNVLANLVVMPHWGIKGVAVVFVLTEAGLTSAYLLVIWQALRNTSQQVILSRS